MKNILLTVLALIWIACLIILIAALTDLFPNLPFKEHALFVGIGFLAISGFLKKAYHKLVKTE